MKTVDGTIDPGKFKMLIEVADLINSDYSDGRSLLQKIIESSTRLVGAEAASLLLYDDNSEKLRFEIALGPKKHELAGREIEADSGIAAWVAKNGQSLISNNPTEDARFSSEVAKAVSFPARSILAVPMKIKGHLVGVIELVNKIGGSGFLPEDQFWLEIFSNQAAIAIENARLFEKTSNELSYLSRKVEESSGWHTLIFASQVMAEKIELADRIATSDVSVLILGESGVGKELFAERLHRMSYRNSKPFVRVSCAALPESLLESELFGHVKGAFTDAIQDREGRFEAAKGGTIFLDEIAELPLRLQAKLLRVLQQKAFEKVGSSQTIQVDVRIVAATNKDLAAMVERQEFRADLYYRLNVLPLVIPPLRERKEDIPVLANYFLKHYARETNKVVEGFSDSAMQSMLTYAWPGNVRELENAVERAVVMTRSRFISSADLMLGNKEANVVDFRGKNLKEAVNSFKSSFIRNALELHGWNQTQTAKELNIQRTYLSRLIKELNIVQTKE
ncbi:MAG TPA: sigma 54-interacting transcriptional regulator [Spirochaetales bacterium]|nr:sigma 54-interacting transcriptional regulator [Spirochaetales bacterium]HPS14884.1 sigma 54-interacting transcriptional regulator [Spirochaetales bacterium]